MAFTADTKLGETLDNPQAKAVLEKHSPEMATAGAMLMMGRGPSLDQIAQFPQAKMTPERLRNIVDALQKL
jgi:hypothetical protein